LRKPRGDTLEYASVDGEANVKVLVVGSGGREHALAWKISRSPLASELHAAPGNAGIAEIAKCHAVAAHDLEGLLALARREKIDLTVVGPEQPLVMGIGDLFRKNGLLLFGPSRAAAELEGSKVFSKGRMKKYGVPTADAAVFESAQAARNHLELRRLPFVLKADGLAAGKGVIIARSREEGERACHAIMEERVFGDAGNRILIEDFLTGEELSILAFTDGENVLPLASSQDHKRAFDGDEGPNTGGMGAYSPCPLVSDRGLHEIAERTIAPVIRGLRSEGIAYQGLIYAGLMMTAGGPFVLEYNVRFGDPETQAILMRLEEDIVPLLAETARGELSRKSLRWKTDWAVTVVLASSGYPGSYPTGFEIRGLERLRGREDLAVFHAGTKAGASGKVVTAGGRVLNVTALGHSLEEARSKVYEACRVIECEGLFYRKDIGEKALTKKA
jgi:phosphoribosylamine--glycine ligase